MKKALALVMAVAMVMSLAAVSFAASTILGTTAGATEPVRDVVPVKGALYAYDGGYYQLASDAEVPFGETVYLMFIEQDGDWATADAVEGLKVSAKWTENGDYIGDVEIVKYKDRYVVAIETTGSSTTGKQVVGEISIKGKSLWEDANGKGHKETVDYKSDIEIYLAYNEIDVTGDFGPGEDLELYDFGDAATPDEVTVTFGPLTAEVETKNMKKVLMSYDDEESEELLDAYVEADLAFINCVATFRRTTEVTIDAEDYEYLYEVVDGALVAVDAEYDEWTEEFTFKTRKLGNYVLSDTELVVEEVVATNPSTGAAA